MFLTASNKIVYELFCSGQTIQISQKHTCIIMIVMRLSDVFYLLPFVIDPQIEHGHSMMIHLTKDNKTI